MPNFHEDGGSAWRAGAAGAAVGLSVEVTSQSRQQREETAPEKKAPEPGIEPATTGIEAGIARCRSAMLRTLSVSARSQEDNSERPPTKILRPGQ